MEAEHRAEADAAERGRGDAADPARAEVRRLERLQAEAEWCHLVWINARQRRRALALRGARKQTLPRRRAAAGR